MQPSMQLCRHTTVANSGQGYGLSLELDLPPGTPLTWLTDSCLLFPEPQSAVLRLNCGSALPQHSVSSTDSTLHSAAHNQQRIVSMTQSAAHSHHDIISSRWRGGRNSLAEQLLRPACITLQIPLALAHAHLLIVPAQSTPHFISHIACPNKQRLCTYCTCMVWYSDPGWQQAMHSLCYYCCCL